jgi:hypothetical protein
MQNNPDNSHRSTEVSTIDRVRRVKVLENAIISMNSLTVWRQLEIASENSSIV